jgi:hypothetical protein
MWCMQVFLSRRGRWEDTETQVPVASTAAAMMASQQSRGSDGVVSLFQRLPLIT